ncbi:MAG: P-loop ATPase, Sll1717 family [Terriglobales bacterium]
MAKAAVVVKIPKGTLKRLTIGESFAEYDMVLEKSGVFVETPAIRAAKDTSRAKCFFVGRRGTGKTAITLFLEKHQPGTAILVLPQLLTPIEEYFAIDVMADTHQRPFKCLVASFKRAMLDEVIKAWIRRGLFSFNKYSSGLLTRERNFIDDFDFDTRLLKFAEQAFDAINKHQHKEWIREINRWKEISDEMTTLKIEKRCDFNLVFDRIDDAWDGSDKAVVLVMALMHACVEMVGVQCVRPLVFLRENVFERVRVLDKEFARLETFVISLEWTRELLLELIERRLQTSLIAKPALHGPTWDLFFETPSSGSSQDIVFSYCQYKPRDVLTYSIFAIEVAQSKAHEQILIEDLINARRRFSDSRLKELGDEYADNYAQLQLVLGRFFGLGREYTIRGVEDFIKKVLVDPEIKEHCKTWIYKYVQPDLFVRLLYDIGFFGIKDEDRVYYRAAGSQSSTPPPISSKTTVVIHPTYADALNLQNILISSLAPEIDLKDAGLVGDLPGAIGIGDYLRTLAELRERLRTLPTGDSHSSEFEEIVGEVLRLCFFRVLTNPEPKVRNVNNRIVRDWVAANHAQEGFWELVRHKYGAVQVIWECKNYSDLAAEDFHQAGYYMSNAGGRFVIMASRGEEKKKSYYEHIQRLAQQHNGLVLIIDGKDLDIILRRTINGKRIQEHLQELFDKTVREIS